MTRNINIEALSEGIRSGERGSLSKGLTLVESSRPEDMQLARQLVNTLLPFSGNSNRIGITGAPGVGKSSFIEKFGLLLNQSGQTVAILSVDPTSPTSGGSILGDKTRMEELGRQDKVFIRPSPSGRENGGVSGSTRDQVILCEAAGFENVIIETVGVGQGETAVSLMVDYLLLLLMAGGGDELQGIKRGIMEVAHGFAFTKTDQVQGGLLNRSVSELRSALHIFRDDHPEVFLTSSVTSEGIGEVLSSIQKFRERAVDAGKWTARRQSQDLEYFDILVQRYVMSGITTDPAFRERLEQARASVREGKMGAMSAAEQVVSAYFPR